MQYEQPVRPPASLPVPSSYFFWGESLGIVAIALAVAAKNFLNQQKIQKQRKQELENELIRHLKLEIRKRDKLIAELNGELTHDNSHARDRENSKLLQGERL